VERQGFRVEGSAVRLKTGVAASNAGVNAGAAGLNALPPGVNAGALPFTLGINDGATTPRLGPRQCADRLKPRMRRRLARADECAGHKRVRGRVEAGPADGAGGHVAAQAPVRGRGREACERKRSCRWTVSCPRCPRMQHPRTQAAKGSEGASAAARDPPVRALLFRRV
jgi:hypothetical protein